MSEKKPLSLEYSRRPPNTAISSEAPHFFGDSLVSSGYLEPHIKVLWSLIKFGVLDENLGVFDVYLGVFNENLGSLMKIWGSSMLIWGSSMKIWGL